MIKIIGCLIDAHDLRLVGAACVVCIVCSWTTMQMLARALAAEGVWRGAWIAAGGTAFGCGVWVTHFVSMLGYAPGVAGAFDLRLTIFSLLPVLVGGWLSLGCALIGTAGAAVMAGLLVGGTVGAMHFIGMAAIELPELVRYDPMTVTVAFAFGFVFGTLGMLHARSGRLWQGAAMLVLAVAGLHFTAMAALSILPSDAHEAGAATTSLAAVVVALGLLVLLAGLGSALVDKHLHARRVLEAERFRRFADATFEGLFFARDGFVLDANNVLCVMLGSKVEDIVGRDIANFFTPESRKRLATLDVDAGGIEVELVDAQGDPHVVDVLARQISRDSSSVAVIAVRDASERKRAEQRMQELVHTDPLTGLANRLLLRDRLGQALAMAERTGGAVAVLCLDLDRFKEVNDLWGHSAGDLLLAEVALRIQAAARDSDTVARLGGDEFVVVQPLLGRPEDADALAKRLLQVLQMPYQLNGSVVEITTSIGIAVQPNDAANGETLLKNADLALYRAKQEGRAGYRFFEPEMDSRVHARRLLEHDVRHALCNGELSVHFQPVWAGGDLRLAGYEALLRWTHPKRGAVSPAVFIAAAEECGAIQQIGAWVLETACAEAASWPGSLGIAVNLSPEQFKIMDLPEMVASTLARTGLAPDRLELEVTEGVLIDDTSRALEVLGALKAQGVRIALDDFGTGYSSLSYLRRFPFDRLKIDRSFVLELGTDVDAEAIVRAILAMSRSLRIAVTAEGVETETQLALLQNLQCDHLQGYLLGRPAPAAELCHASAAKPETVAMLAGAE